MAEGDGWSCTPEIQNHFWMKFPDFGGFFFFFFLGGVMKELNLNPNSAAQSMQRWLIRAPAIGHKGRLKQEIAYTGLSLHCCSCTATRRVCIPVNLQNIKSCYWGNQSHTNYWHCPSGQCTSSVRRQRHSDRPSVPGSRADWIQMTFSSSNYTNFNMLIVTIDYSIQMTFLRAVTDLDWICLI